MYSAIIAAIHGLRPPPGTRDLHGRAFVIDGPNATRIGFDALNKVSGYSHDYNPLYGKDGSYVNKETGNNYFLPKGLNARNVQDTARGLIMKLKNSAGCCK